ncbi:hypothetical protein LDENG_00200110, partial [Lucifuga dentata]
LKQGGGSIIVWGCFVASGSEHLQVIEATINLKLYQETLEENVRVMIDHLKFYTSWMMQEDNN